MVHSHTLYNITRCFLSQVLPLLSITYKEIFAETDPDNPSFCLAVPVRPSHPCGVPCPPTAKGWAPP